MDKKIANAMSGYFETLYVLNQKLIKLCGAEIFYYRYSKFEKIILDIIQDIPRLIPYSYYNDKEGITLDNKNGLLEYKKQIKYIENNYQNILDVNFETLNNIRKIRNKYEHKMHDVEYQSSQAGSMSLFYIEFKINNEPIEIYVGDLIKIVEELNILFSKIAQEIEIFAYENGLQEYTYYQRLCRFDFNDFNEIYESDLLKKIGKIMNEF